MQSELLEQDAVTKGSFDLGRGYMLRLPNGPCCPGDLYHRGSFSKRVNLADKAEKRLLVVELVKNGVNQTRLSKALDLSRQTLHNYSESYRKFGVIGLLHGYSPSESSSRELQARIHVKQRRPGSKARELEALRRAERAQTLGAEQDELALNGDLAAVYTLVEPAITEAFRGDQPTFEAAPTVTQPTVAVEADPTVTQPTVEAEPTVSQPTVEAELTASPALTDEASEANSVDTPDAPSPLPAPALELSYAKTHDWEANRYAGIFPVLLVLISQWKWMARILPLYGNGWRIFQVFVLMVVRNIRSIEQLKNEQSEEVARILGLKAFPSLNSVWRWFHDAAAKKQAGTLLKTFFADQIRDGQVGLQLWYTDGHLLPYTGQDKVHASWNTQRRMPTPGQTNLVTCDEQGRIVYFDIQEGKGDLRAQILKLGEYARAQSLDAPPVQVFDREGDGLRFFSELVSAGTPFITWEKNANQAQLLALQEADFTHRIEVNGKSYRLLEQSKTCVYVPKADPDSDSNPDPDTGTGALEPSHSFTLRRVVVWNQRTNHRTSVLCWDAGLELSIEKVASAMLGRWGASENSFKHLQERHPYHYHPGFALNESDKQDIANPQIEVLAQQISAIQRDLSKLYKAHAKSQPLFKQDGSERLNSKHRRLTEAIAANEAEVKRLRSEKAQLPERVDVSTLTDYRSFKAIDNEGKNLFDFVTSLVWNARRQLLDWLLDLYAKDNDRVDLLYTIFNCHGWVRCDEKWVVVRLQPIRQPARRYAQEQLCRKLTGLGARIPGGKWLRIEVGDSPL